MDPAIVGLRIGSGVLGPIIRRLFPRDGPGDGSVEHPVRLAALVSLHGEKRTLEFGDLCKLTDELVHRTRRAVGPYERFPADEHGAVVEAVATTLYGLGELDMDDVQAVGLGPERFARRLRAQAPDVCLELSADAARFHDRLVDTASAHILHFFTQRSTFVARTLVEQTRRLDEVTRLLERLPAPDQTDARFETEYLDSLVRQHGQLTIVGVDFANSPDSWSLDTAYLPLAVESPDDGADGDGQGPLPPVPVEHALAEPDRVLVRGMAGSGKTTLVQWLAVTTAEGGLPAELEPLRGRIPFVLPVRRFSDRDFPTPEEFLSAARHPMAGAEPGGWAVRVLTAGRGLLLVDGIDEAPVERREPIRRELDRLLRTFPGNRWLVTSRPTAVTGDWLGMQGFTELSLAPMNRDQVAEFIRSWHAAAAVGLGESGGGDRERLPEYERRLLNSVRLIRELRRLAANPLMCGLICALNRDRRGILPRGRKALYKAALAMLLERRDPEREVHADGIVLDGEAKERLLQKLAHWMLLNDRSEVSRERAVGILAGHLPAIPSAGEQGTAEEMFQHLLHRTGLLRMPTPDTVDFVHRTFQDYLSAKEAVERQDFPFLVNNAHRSDWDEVVRMAVSLARPDECASLLESLVSVRPRESRAEAKYCKLLAASCLSDATELNPETQALVRQRTRFLVQPDTVPAARRLGWIGPIVLELLPDPEGASERKALLLAATASGVRDDAAIDYLVRLRGHPSPAVRAELAGAWRRFDTERYADDVIAHLDPDGLYFTVTDVAELAALRRLGGRERIKVAGQLSPEELAAGLDADRLTHLYLLVYDSRRGLGWLRGFPRLASVRLGRHVETPYGMPKGVRVERDAEE